MNAEQLIVNIENHCEHKISKANEKRVKWEREHGKLPKWHQENIDTEIREVNAFKMLIQVVRTLQREVEFHDFDKAVQRCSEKKWYKVVDKDRDYRDTILMNIQTQIEVLREAIINPFKTFDMLNSKDTDISFFRLTKSLEVALSTITTIEGHIQKYEKIKQDNKQTLFE